MGKQTSLFGKINWKHRYQYGGRLRRERAGRGSRPLSGKNTLHLIFKANREVVHKGFRIPRRFALIHHLVQKYAARFYVKISHISIQGDHIHLHIRTNRRSNYQSFFRVAAGQIAQQFEKEGLLTLPPRVTDTPSTPANPRKAKGVTDTPAGATGEGKSVGQMVKKLWNYRPYTRVVRSYRDFKNVQDYIQLNEQEALGNLPYRKSRLKGLSSAEWELLWN